MGRCSLGGGSVFRCNIWVGGVFLYLVFPGSPDFGCGGWDFLLFFSVFQRGGCGGPAVLFCDRRVFLGGGLAHGKYFLNTRMLCSSFCTLRCFLNSTWVFSQFPFPFSFSCPLGFLLALRFLFCRWGVCPLRNNFPNYHKLNIIFMTKTTNLLPHPCVFWVGIFCLLHWPAACFPPICYMLRRCSRYDQSRFPPPRLFRI